MVLQYRVALTLKMKAVFMQESGAQMLTSMMALVELDYYAGYGFSIGEVGVDIGYIAFDYPENQTGLDFEEIYLGLSFGDLGLTLASGQDGAPDYTEVSYALGPVSFAYGEYDEYGDNITVSYSFLCGSYECGVAAYDFSDTGYGADEDGIYFSISASL
jgi:hypothetical protein